MPLSEKNTKHVYSINIQRQPNVFDVGPTLYNCNSYTHILSLLGYISLPIEIKTFAEFLINILHVSRLMACWGAPRAESTCK